MGVPIGGASGLPQRPQSMSLYRSGRIWWIELSTERGRIRRSAGTSDKKQAQEYHERVKGEIWRQERLGEAPQELECTVGERFSLIWVSSQCFNYAKLEKKIHDRMRKYRRVGEWFGVPFLIAVEVARSYSYKGLSRKRRIEPLRAASERVKPV